MIILARRLAHACRPRGSKIPADAPASRAETVQASTNAPKWGFSTNAILRLHYDGAHRSEERTHVVLLVRVDSLQRRAATRFAPPWRIHGTEAAYLVPIDSAPGELASAWKAARIQAS
jgi:hypothetical protein